MTTAILKSNVGPLLQIKNNRQNMIKNFISSVTLNLDTISTRTIKWFVLIFFEIIGEILYWNVFTKSLQFQRLYKKIPFGAIKIFGNFKCMIVNF